MFLEVEPATDPAKPILEIPISSLPPGIALCRFAPVVARQGGVRLSGMDDWQLDALCRGSHAYLFFSALDVRAQRRAGAQKDEGESDLRGMSGAGPLHHTCPPDPGTVRYLGRFYRSRKKEHAAGRMTTGTGVRVTEGGAHRPAGW